MKKLCVLFNYLMLIIHQVNAQSVDEYYASNINLPQDILLSFPTTAWFIDENISAEQDYELIEKKPSDSIPKIISGKLFNPHVSKITIPKYDLITERYQYSQFEASYIDNVSSKNYQFKSVGFDIMKKNLSHYLGIEDSIVYFPASWNRQIENDTIESILFICYVRISSQGFPIEKRKYIRPFRLITKKKIYDIQTNYRDHTLYAYIGPLYGGYITRNCPNNDSITIKYVELVKHKIIKNLQSEPFLAVVCSDFATPDGEIWLKRNYLPSHVLGGSYFENSTYILKFNYFGSEEINDLKFYIVQSLNINVGLKGDYYEPEENKVSKYKLLINNMVNQCIKEACIETRLNYVDTTCKCK